MFNQPEVEFAVEAVREAANAAQCVQQTLVTSALTKGDRSPVTVADFAAQAIVAKRLADRFPDVTLIGEESADALRSAEGAETLEQILPVVRKSIPGATADDICDWIDAGSGTPPSSYWTLDPVDGTKGYLRGDQYAVALGYVVDGVVQVGALGCPELEDAQRPAKGGVGSLLVGVRGRGAFAKPLADSNPANGGGDWAALKVDSRSDVTQARLLRSVEKGHTNTGGIGKLVETLGITANPTPMDSQAKYALLAAGAGDVNLRLLSPDRPDYREKIWDQAAGSIIVEEAGGRVSDLDGKPLDFSQGRTLAANRGLLATNGPLHEALLAGLKAIGA